MKAVFLGDAHLIGRQDPNFRRFVSFLNSLREGGRIFAPGELTDLFFVGDVFDFWFARGTSVYPPFEEIIARLGALAAAGVRIHLCEGNHDFSLGDYFSRLGGFSVYEGWGEMEAEGIRILFGHGDLVDGENRRYLLLRRILRSRAFYAFQGLLPRRFLWEASRAFSALSRDLEDGKSLAMFKKMESFARERFREGYDAVVLGHCHVPHVGVWEERGRVCHFVTLGDWVRHFSYVTYDGKRGFVLDFQRETGG